ncbi:hypothetical protein U9M48_015815, partial [Paspalum notatum var. saurae]
MAKAEEERGEASSQAVAVLPGWRMPRGRGTIRRLQRMRAAASEGQDHKPADESQQPSPDDDLEDAEAALEHQGSPHEGTALDPATLAARWVTEDGGRWVILACVPRVAHGLPGAVPFVAASTPPRTSRLTVHHLFAPDHKEMDNYPYIASVNRRGLLLYASQRELGLNKHEDKAYFLFKRTTTGSGRHVFRLPARPRIIINPGNVCVVGDNVFGLDTTKAKLGDSAGLYYCSPGPQNQLGGRQWTARTVFPPQRHWNRPWGAHGTIYHDDKIWWVDLSCGLLYGVPHDMVVVHARKDLRFVALPDGFELPPRTPDLDKKRCVGVSTGKLRYVQIHKLRCRNGELVPVVSMWTLIDETTGEWRRDCRTPLKWIWDKLKPDGKIPAVALIHPNHGDVVYFFKDFCIVGVDVREGRVLEWQFNAMLHPPLPYHSSRFVRPWLPMELVATRLQSMVCLDPGGGEIHMEMDMDGKFGGDASLGAGGDEERDGEDPGGAGNQARPGGGDVVGVQVGRAPQGPPVVDYWKGPNKNHNIDHVKERQIEVPRRYRGQGEFIDYQVQELLAKYQDLNEMLEGILNIPTIRAKGIKQHTKRLWDQFNNRVQAIENDRDVIRRHGGAAPPLPDKLKFAKQGR